MKKTVLLLVLATVTIVAVGQNKKPSSKKPSGGTQTGSSSAVAMKSSLDSFSYAIGLSVGKFYKNQGISSIRTNLMLKGIGDAMNGSKAPLMSEMDANQCVQTYISGLKSKQAESGKASGHKFLDSISKQAGVVKLPSGLQYKVLQAGTDTVHPKSTDVVKFHYRGMLADGSEFDNSYKRGEPLTHPVNQLIPGWTEALQLMTPGSKWILYIPSNLGYGDNGAGDVIPPGATLVFEVELLEIVKQ